MRSRGLVDVAFLSDRLGIIVSSPEYSGKETSSQVEAQFHRSLPPSTSGCCIEFTTM